FSDDGLSRYASDTLSLPDALPISGTTSTPPAGRRATDARTRHRPRPRPGRPPPRPRVGARGPGRTGAAAPRRGPHRGTPRSRRARRARRRPGTAGGAARLRPDRTVPRRVLAVRGLLPGVAGAALRRRARRRGALLRPARRPHPGRAHRRRGGG